MKSIPCSVACWSLVALSLGCGGYTARHLERGDAYFDRQLYRAAITEYTRAVRFAPDHPRGIRQLGLAHQRLGERREAYVFLEKAVKLEPNDPVARLALGSLYLDDRRPADAVTQARTVLAAAPENLDAWNLLGSARLVLGEPGPAIQAFREIVELAPRDPRGPYLLGLGLAAQGKEAEAGRQFEAALALDSTFADPLIRLVEMDRVAGHLDEALSRIQEYLRHAGDSPRLENLLGVVHAARGNAEAAETAFRKAIELEPSFGDAYARLAELHRATGRLREALATANQAVLADSASLGAWMVLGYTHQQLGDLAQARQAYERALAVNPRFAPAANNLAWILAEQGVNGGRALSLAELAKRESPEDPHISDTLGWVLYKLGEYRRAVAALSESAAKLPGNPGVHYRLGLALGKSGDTTAAREALRLALGSSEPFPEREAARQALAALQ
jgi:tetratricopeptide (TPR) repeat protein